MSSVLKNDLNYGMTDRVLELTRKLAGSSVLTREELAELLTLLGVLSDEPVSREIRITDRVPSALCTKEEACLFESARAVREEAYGKDVYLRGLIEFTNHCRNDCYYCGIRRSNQRADRYRLSREEILECCRQGYALGFRTFVLQGGEDLFYTDLLDR